MNWFTSDQHFNHANVIEFCKRPFDNVDQMNRVMIEKWNSRIRSIDTTFVVGDFKFGSGATFHDLNNALNGNKVFVQGNHDKNNGVNTGIKTVHLHTFGMDILLTHRVVDAYKIIEGYDLALVGHCHTEWKFRKNVVNVGVDVWDFFPIHMKQILKAYKTWEKGGG
jgi:calcineurin-like phosphoesterase family protein